jgi:hypothetical protein
MDPDINIQKVKFEFNMDNEESAFELYSDWYSFYHSMFEKVVEKVLEKSNKKDVHLFIEKLDINLGEIPKKDFYDKFPLILEEKLEELMQKLKLDNNVEEIRKISTRFLLFESFTYYLVHGFYPWPGNELKDDFKTQFIKILNEYSREFREFLFTYGHFNSLRRRLVLQLEDDGLRELVTVINNIESPFIISYFNLLINKETHQKVGAGKVKDHRDACWEVILSYLLVRKGGYFNRKEFVDYTIRELAAHYNLEYRLLLSFLTETAAWFLHESGAQSELKKILIELNEEIIAQDEVDKGGYSDWIVILKDSINRNSLSENFNVNRFFDQLADKELRTKFLNTFTYSQLEKLIELMAKRDPSALLEFNIPISFLLDSSMRLAVTNQFEIIQSIPPESVIPAISLAEIRKLLKQPQSRRLLISKLDDPAIISLVKLIEPNESTFIIAYAKSLDEQKEKNIFEGKAGGEFRQLKWEFIFTVMIEDADISFNRKSFVLSVITMLASHYNIKTLDLLSYIYKAILEGIISIQPDLAAVLEELYFELKAERPKLQEVNLFDKTSREAWYSSLLKDFIQTGKVPDQTFTEKMSDVLDYLLTYRPDLLISIIEDLKNGFVLNDLTSIPHHKEFYRKLIQFTVNAYKISLPEGQRVKSLFDNLGEDRFQSVSVATFKTLLLALLRNDTSLYEKAWDILTDRVSPIKLVRLDNLKVIPDEVLLKIISLPDTEVLQLLITTEPVPFIEKVFSSIDLLESVVECYLVYSSVAENLEKALHGISLSYIFKKLHQLFSSESEALKIFFRFMVLVQSKGVNLNYGHILFDILISLVINKEPFFEKEIRKIFENEPTIRENQAVFEFLTTTANSLSMGSSLKSTLETIISEMSKPIADTIEQTEEMMIGEKSFVVWLINNFPVGFEFSESKISRKSAMFNPGAYAAFEKLMIDQPELIRQLVSMGKLSKFAITDWIKIAPLSTQLRWLQVQASPYQKIVIDEAMMLINWLQAAIARIPGSLFSWSKISALLIDFSSGKLQNIDRNELFARIVTICLEQIDLTERDRVIEEVKTKASNHGQLWGMRIQTVLRIVLSEEGKVAEPLSPKTESTLKSIPEEEPDVLEEIYISNAGLVLCSPFLPLLFNRLGLLKDGIFLDRKSNERAVLLLQYMLYHETFFPEYQLVLCKVLCGLTTGTPIDCNIEVTELEKTTMEQMLAGMIQHWNKLGHTSVEGLIESFLLREGKLVQKEDNWHLTVEQKSYDMLLDSIPWSYSPIKFSWMKKVINVKWR